tara:strand:- start:1065 stop:1448 length:384 start_codon:yes stop_codon:yes gene_type:complete
MDYKKMMGYGGKKKVTKKESKPKVNKIIESVKEQINETFLGIQTMKDNPPFKTQKQINETLPSFPKEWKNVEKSMAMFEKSVKVLEKAVSKVDKSHSRTIMVLWKDTSNRIKKFKDLLEKEVLGKLQ